MELVRLMLELSVQDEHRGEKIVVNWRLKVEKNEWRE